MSYTDHDHAPTTKGNSSSFTPVVIIILIVLLAVAMGGILILRSSDPELTTPATTPEDLPTPTVLFGG